MAKKVVVVNAGPRIGWNTDMLLREAEKGVIESGAEVVRFDLFRLNQYTGAYLALVARKTNSKDTASRKMD